MKKLRLFTLLIFTFFIHQKTFSTFSIVAVDPETGEVGSAGASCIDNNSCGGCGGVVIISDLVPGKGAVNSQAWACIPNTNLQQAINWMKQGKTPSEIIELLKSNDACQAKSYDFRYRQYGIADLDDNGQARTAGFSGEKTDAYSNHLLGTNYAIQGNILLGPEILQGIKEGFENETGSLACKLMAALQGANVPGADSRCLNEGVSTQSAFLRVAKSTDIAPDFSINIVVKSTPYGVEPIDELQNRFDQEVNCTATSLEGTRSRSLFELYPNPFSDRTVISVPPAVKGELEASIFNVFGQKVRSEKIEGHSAIIERDGLTAGVYFIRISAGKEVIASKRLIVE